VDSSSNNKTVRRLILGTAGHVDHGKTELIRALTGWHTDRLKEEKERGISIELGFAPLRIDDETMFGVVDVPGHERFVKHMVAGAGGIDLAMLLVAADEGVMPQTKEHLEVLVSLGISSGVILISKCDLVDEDMIRIVRDDVADLVKGTFLESAPVVETSVKTGHGIERLKTVLRELSERVPPRDTEGPFRLAIDRVFHMRGIGVVVTGSAYSGTVAVGSSLQLLPSEKSVRVRELQSFGEKRQCGYAGERLAIALQGVKLSEVHRGDMLVSPSHFRVSRLLDARVHLARYATFELKQRERIRVHHGAREVLGRVVLLEHDVLRSGDRALVQVRLENPIIADVGDLFVIRKYSPPRVLGGGRVIDPNPETHRRHDAAVLRNLELHERGDAEQVLVSAVRDAGLHGCPRERFGNDEVRRQIESGTLFEIEGTLFHGDTLRDLAGEIHRLTREYVAANPLRYGMDKEELRQKVGFPHPTPLFNGVLETLAGMKPIHVRDNRVRADTEDVDLPDSLAAEVASLERFIRDAGVVFPGLAAIEDRWSGSAPVADALRYLEERGKIIKIGTEGFIHREPFERCLNGVTNWFEKHSDLSVGDFKDMFALTRKHAIPLLEHMDQTRFTARQGNLRRPGPRLASGLEGGSGNPA
jgi:selenocysteine-specific elongation factor